MNDLLIITPVKDSPETARLAISKIVESKGEWEYLVYDDRSNAETKGVLKSIQGIELVYIEDEVDTPSPNYRFTLIDAQKKAKEKKAGLLIIESDVFVKPDTIQELYDFAQNKPECGMVAAITVDENDRINFPYEHMKTKDQKAFATSHRLSFCCTLLTESLLEKLDFNNLSESKDWFDVQISRDSRNLGFINYVLPATRVEHLPHSSRPWKKLKYSNPVKYYLRKWFLGRDRI